MQEEIDSRKIYHLEIAISDLNAKRDSLNAKRDSLNAKRELMKKRRIEAEASKQALQKKLKSERMDAK